jgi:hypothetical protein
VVKQSPTYLGVAVGVRVIVPTDIGQLFSFRLADD